MTFPANPWADEPTAVYKEGLRTHKIILPFGQAEKTVEIDNYYFGPHCVLGLYILAHIYRVLKNRKLPLKVIKSPDGSSNGPTSPHLCVGPYKKGKTLVYLDTDFKSLILTNAHTTFKTDLPKTTQAMLGFLEAAHDAFQAEIAQAVDVAAVLSMYADLWNGSHTDYQIKPLPGSSELYFLDLWPNFRHHDYRDGTIDIGYCHTKKGPSLKTYGALTACHFPIMRELFDHFEKPLTPTGLTLPKVEFTPMEVTIELA